MSISSVSYDWGVDPIIIRLTTDSTLATITTAGFWTLPATQADIESLNNGALDVPEGSIWAINYSDGEGFFTLNTTTNAFVAEADPGSLSETLPDGDIFVGSALNVATGVTMSGDATIIADGTLTIANDAVTSAKVDETLIQHAQVDLSLAEFIGSYTASALVLAAPGANKKIVVHRATLWINYGGTVLADGGTVQLQYADDANAAGTFATGTVSAASLIAATADTSFGFSPVDTTLTDATTLNEGLYLSTATADFTGGTGSAYKVDVWYSIMDVA